MPSIVGHHILLNLVLDWDECRHGRSEVQWVDLMLEELPSLVGCAPSFTSDGVESALARGVHVEE